MLIFQIKCKVAKHLGDPRDLDTDTILKTLYEAGMNLVDSQRQK